MLPFEFWVGFRYFMARRRHAFISVITVVSIIGVLIGVTALIVVLAVMTGFDKTLREKILGATADVVVRKYAGIEADEKILGEIESLPNVSGASPLVDGQVLLTTDAGLRGVVLNGIDPVREPRVTQIGEWIAEGKLTFATPKFPLTQGDHVEERGIVIGVEMAKEFGIRLGDLVTLVSSQQKPEFGGLEPKMRAYQVTGLFRAGMYEFDRNVIYISHQSAMSLLNKEGRWPAIHVKLKNSKKTMETVDRVAERLGSGYSVQSWIELNRDFFAALELERKAMAIILILIILVASSNIACTLIMVVIEKTKDIGLLKAMGATGKTIVTIFVAQGLYIGVVGTTLGCGLGYGICRILDKYRFIRLPEVYYMDTLPVYMRVWDFVWIACAAIVISLLATLYPAFRAARMDPVEALRDE